LGIDLVEHEKPEGGLFTERDKISNWKQELNTNHQGGDIRVARETGNESDCRVQDRLMRGKSCLWVSSIK